MANSEECYAVSINSFSSLDDRHLALFEGDRSNRDEMIDRELFLL